MKGPPGPIGPAGIPGHDGRPGVQGEAGTVGQPVSKRHYQKITTALFYDYTLAHFSGPCRTTRRKRGIWTSW